MLGCPGSKGGKETKEGHRGADRQRMSSNGRTVYVVVDKQYDEGNGCHKGCRVAVEEDSVAAWIIVQKNRIARMVPGLIVLEQEAARRGQPGLVCDGGDQNREDEQTIAHPVQQTGILLLSAVVIVGLVQQDNMDDHIDQSGTADTHGVNGGCFIPAAPDGICTHKAKQIQYHGLLQRAVLEQRPYLDKDDTNQGGCEGYGVAVEESVIPPIVGRSEYRVAGFVAVSVVLPKATGRIQPRLVSDGQREGGEELNKI